MAFLKHVNRNTKREPPQLQECSTTSSPLPFGSHNPIIDDLKDDQVVLRDQIKPKDCETTTTISVFLPFELWQSIIDNLSGDMATLRACSLTCRAFLHPSRYHIFHHISLLRESEAWQFLDEICLADSPTSPCTYVRDLYVCESEGAPQSLPLFLKETLPLLATHLLNVTKLDLCGLDWVTLGNSAQDKILSGFQKVEKIKIYGSFGTSEQANRFISSFPSLTTIICRKMGWKSYNNPVIPLPRSLKFISLPSPQSNFFNQLLHLESHPDVSTICFRWVDLKDVKAMGELLKTLGSHLEHLKLGNMSYIGAIARENHINLAHNTNLRSVSLDNPTANMRINSLTLDWMSTLLSQITSSRVKYVSLVLTTSFFCQLEKTDWSLIENLFTQHHWSNLRLVEIMVFDGNVEQVASLIKTGLPILCSRVTVRATRWYGGNVGVFSEGFDIDQLLL